MKLAKFGSAISALSLLIYQSSNANALETSRHHVLSSIKSSLIDARFPAVETSPVILERTKREYAQSSPCQWSYSFVSGVATATYCGNVVVQGSGGGGGVSTATAPLAITGSNIAIALGSANQCLVMNSGGTAWGGGACVSGGTGSQGAAGEVQAATGSGTFQDTLWNIPAAAYGVMDYTGSGGIGQSSNGPIVLSGTLSYNPVLNSSVSITSGTYNNSTGAVSLTLGTSQTYLSPGQQVLVSGLTGTGAFASLDGTWTAGSGSGTTTLNYAAASGLGAATITGGTASIGYTHSAILGSGTYVNSGISAIGVGQSIYGHACTVIGYGAVCGVASGTSGVASPGSGTAIGINALATGGSDVALGTNAASSSGNGLAIGNGSTVSFGNGVAVGASSVAGATDAVAIGAAANSSYVYSVAVGFGATATAQNQFIAGGSTIADLYAGAGAAAVHGTKFVSTGSPPANSGTCAINTPVGGIGAFEFTLNGSCAASGTLVFTYVAAPNGWACAINDLTANNSVSTYGTFNFGQSGYLANQVTFKNTGGGTIATGEQYVVSCQAF